MFLIDIIWTLTAEELPCITLASNWEVFQQVSEIKLIQYSYVLGNTSFGKNDVFPRKKRPWKNIP